MADLNIMKLFQLYKAREVLEGRRAVSFSTYKRIFGTEHNLGFYHPRKDQCQTCAQFQMATEEQKQALQVKHDAHIQRKGQAQEAKKAAIEDAKETADTKVITFDLQSVLQIPSSPVSQFYYKRKICMYNLTVYECTPPNNAHCFVWTEVDGKRGSNDIGSCILQYIQKLPATVTKLILFSDSCAGQNRNQYVMAGLLWAVEKSHLRDIELYFLETGHTQMECDSMHAEIEFQKRHKSLYGVNDWLNLMAAARRINPYQIHRLSFKVHRRMRMVVGQRMMMQK